MTFGITEVVNCGEGIRYKDARMRDAKNPEFLIHFNFTHKLKNKKVNYVTIRICSFA